MRRKESARFVPNAMKPRVVHPTKPTPPRPSEALTSYLLDLELDLPADDEVHICLDIFANLILVSTGVRDAFLVRPTDMAEELVRPIFGALSEGGYVLIPFNSMCVAATWNYQKVFDKFNTAYRAIKAQDMKTVHRCVGEAINYPAAADFAGDGTAPYFMEWLVTWPKGGRNREDRTAQIAANTFSDRSLLRRGEDWAKQMAMALHPLGFRVTFEHGKNEGG